MLHVEINWISDIHREYWCHCAA